MSAPSTSLGTALADLAAAHPDEVAITCGPATITWGELERTSNRLAHAYRARGVTPDSLVTINLPNGIEFFQATVATWKAGATPQPISDRLPAGERNAIIALAQPSLVVGGAEAGPAGVATIAPGYIPDPSVPNSPLPPLIAESFKAPTSGGSTGRPKLIVASQPATLETFAGMRQFSGMRLGGVHLATGPLHHNGPFLFSLTALFAGNHVVLMERFDAATALELVERHRVDWMYMVPTMMHRIWRLDLGLRAARDMRSLRVVFHTAAPCPPWLKQSWIEWLGGERIIEIYAGTEGQAVTGINGVEWLEHPGSVGRPISGEFSVRDAAGHEVAPTNVGTVWMRSGPGRRANYRYVGAEATAMADGWETLGDLGWMDADGYLFLSDRDTDMLLVGGSNVYPAEVEGALMEHHAVADACVIGLPDDDLGSIPHALVFLSAEVSDDDLRAHVRSRLAPYKAPRTFERVGQPLRDDAGKVRRAALRAERMPKAR